MYRLSHEELQNDWQLPKIPITPISYTDATKLLSQLQGDAAPEDWQGKVPSQNDWDGVYKLGGILKNNQ